MRIAWFIDLRSSREGGIPVCNVYIRKADIKNVEQSFLAVLYIDFFLSTCQKAFSTLIIMLVERVD